MATDHANMLTPEDFDDFYYDVYNRRPFAWQKRLAAEVCLQGWPDFLNLPTSSGKTTVIDIAVFALAHFAANYQRHVNIKPTPRRIFFVVDRRIVVNEAYQQARRMAEKLRSTLILADRDESNTNSTLRRVAAYLQQLSGNAAAPPLDCFELRGGIFRNDNWVRSLLQPTILTTTVDQIGSRLLFRGYGVSDRNLPIHAALTANDSLIILDEAHCSQAFSQTIACIKRYRSTDWCTESLATPFAFVQMTATPPSDLQGKQVFRLEEADYQTDKLLAERHGCVKPITLHIAEGAKGNKMVPALAKKLCEKANLLASENGCKKIAVIVNRVNVARECFALLSAKYSGRVDLMVGAMRPIDRDLLTDKLQEQFGSRISNEEETETRFVVSTQCIEVGADFDFDGIVSQCASLDALRQRFGRLNRLGKYAHACGAIVIAEEDLIAEDKLDDEKTKHPIYGHGLAFTWYWLNEIAESQLKQSSQGTGTTVDFGIWALDAKLKNEENQSRLLAPTIDAQVLMPAHLDMLCQTSPRPFLEPEISAFLHGPSRAEPEVRVCWRADLEWTGTPKDQELWSETVNALPPAVGELLTVKLRIFKSWLKDELKQDDSSDVLGEYVNNEEVIKPKVNAISRVHAIRRVLAWRGIKDTDGFAVPDTDLVDASSAWRVRPYDIVVIPVECGGWDELGYIPESPQLPDHSPSEIYDAMMDSSAEMSRQQDSQALSRLDIAEQACLLSRAKTVFRAHAKLKREGALRQLSEKMLKEFRKEGTGQKEANWSLSNWQAELSELIELNRKAEGSGEKLPTTEQRLLSWSAGAQSKTKGLISTYPNGVIWITERHNEMLQSIAKLPESCFDGDDLNANQPLSLLQHSADVLAVATDHVAQARLSDLVEQSVKQAALMHDIGKADPRFQARLRGKPLSMIYMLPELLAKSGVDTPKLTPNPLPSGFRHEVVSVGLLDHYCWDIDAEDLGLIRYLVAVHHGYGRPFFPTVVDETPPALDVRSMGGQFVESAVREQWRQEHRVEAGQGMRFWQMNRRFGWWGVTWLEAIVRLADWNASAYPGQGDIKTLTWPKSKSDSAKDEAAQVSRFELIGLDGSNPLGFLAALGCLRTLTRSVPAYAWRLHWEKLCGGWRPVVTAIGTEKLDLDRFLVLLEGGFLALPEEHPALRLAQSEDGLRIGDRFRQVSKMATGANREDADWLSCNGSDLLMEEAISQLQTSRRDYHSINIRGLLKETTREHLVRTLFKSWDYADALAGVSLHLEPREDRRHAYQWHKPSGDPTRGVSGGMIGANRLALEAWPLFQSLPEGEKLRTVGFHGTRVSDTKWRWCLWDGACDLDTIQSLLNAEFVHAASRSEKECIERGVPVVFYCSRILVGKTPNLTPALALESTFR